MPSPLLRCGVAGLAVVALALSSCSADNGGRHDTAAPATTAASSDETSPSPSGRPSSHATPSPTPTPSPTSSARPAGLRGLLPTAAELPAISGTTWAVRRTTALGSDPVGACQPYGMLTLGAERGVQRDYRLVDGSGRGTAVAVTFPDATNTQRARQVLVSLHDRCAQHLRQQGHTDARLSPITQAPGGAWWYDVTWTGASGPAREAFGVAVHDHRMVLVTAAGRVVKDHRAAASTMTGALRVATQLLASAG